MFPIYFLCHVTWRASNSHKHLFSRLKARGEKGKKSWTKIGRIWHIRPKWNCFSYKIIDIYASFQCCICIHHFKILFVKKAVCKDCCVGFIAVSQELLFLWSLSLVLAEARSACREVEGQGWGREIRLPRPRAGSCPGLGAMAPAWRVAVTASHWAAGNSSMCQ